jgi:hypothetical protein
LSSFRSKFNKISSSGPELPAQIVAVAVAACLFQEKGDKTTFPAINAISVKYFYL